MLGSDATNNNPLLHGSYSVHDTTNKAGSARSTAASPPGKVKWNLPVLRLGRGDEGGFEGTPVFHLRHVAKGGRGGKGLHPLADADALLGSGSRS